VERFSVCKHSSRLSLSCSHFPLAKPVSFSPRAGVRSGTMNSVKNPAQARPHRLPGTPPRMPLYASRNARRGVGNCVGTSVSDVARAGKPVCERDHARDAELQLRRTMLYTGLTRAVSRVILVGSKSCWQGRLRSHPARSTGTWLCRWASHLQNGDGSARKADHRHHRRPAGCRDGRCTSDC
jgi:hypothetical protein